MSARGLIVDGLTVVALLLVIAALVFALAGSGTISGPRRSNCMMNVRNLVGLIEAVGDDYPTRGGSALILLPVARGELPSEDHLDLLFCPGDRFESLRLAGGIEAYADIDLDGDLDHLTSYAGRAQDRPVCRVRRAEVAGGVALVSDDSEDHHDFRGYVIGYTGGAVRWRDKFDDWNLAPDDRIGPGHESPVAELRCLRAD